MDTKLRPYCLKLMPAHQRITTPTRIQGLQILDSYGKVVIECSLLFRYNKEAKRFDIIQRAWLQGKVAPTDTVIAHCAQRQELEFLLTASGTSLKGQFRKEGQLEHNEFSVGYAAIGNSVSLSALNTEKITVRFVPQLELYRKQPS